MSLSVTPFASLDIERNVNLGFEGDEEGKEKQHESSPPHHDKTEVKESEQTQRQQWNNKREFLLSCISVCVGFGNVWRFSFVALENGGGAFFIPYLVVLVVISKPLYYFEIILGQFSSSHMVAIWAICPAFRGIGYGQLVCNWCLSTYYISIVALCLFYFIASFSSVLPWAVCGSWASSGCVPVHANASVLYITNDTLQGQEKISSAEEYLVKEVLKVDPEGFHNGIGLPDGRLVLCMLVTWALIFMAQIKGVRSSGKIAYFTALFPYVVLLTMLIRGLTLPGSLNGILYLVTPRWEMLLDLKVWMVAVNQAFFSLGIGFGTAITISSYNHFKNNVYLDAAVVSYVDAFTSALAGITNFAILGHLADQLGVDVSQVVRGGGTSLVFISFPDALARFTYLPQLFSVMFFLMMFTLGLGSGVGFSIVSCTFIGDKYPGLRVWQVTLVVCVVGFLVGLIYTTPQGQHILTFVDYFCSGLPIFLLMTLELVGVLWVYGLRRFIRDIHFMLNRSTGFFWQLCWGVFNPIFMAVVFIYSLTTQRVLTYGTYVFDNTVIGVGQALSAMVVALVPLVFLKEVSSKYDSSKELRQALADVFTATSEWSPKDPALRREYCDLLAAETEAQARRRLSS